MSSNRIEVIWAAIQNGNDLTQKCQIETLDPKMIVERIPTANLKKFKYLPESGHSQIYTAIWIDGHYTEWDSKEKQLKRLGTYLKD
ncbi:kinase-like domain-containing protein [Rhizophagus clarus]|uniref:Kinase-like domain-containing protein n=1 Tax=Rhizophagus clarus TaxID=94130 RepID=A0A8H3L4C6_9GLOM|nr:kinase-like domain-containing protein [Rhizophagus clarus]